MKREGPPGVRSSPSSDSDTQSNVDLKALRDEREGRRGSPAAVANVTENKTKAKAVTVPLRRRTVAEEGLFEMIEACKDDGEDRTFSQSTESQHWQIVRRDSVGKPGTKGEGKTKKQLVVKCSRKSGDGIESHTFYSVLAVERFLGLKSDDGVKSRDAAGSSTSGGQGQKRSRELIREPTSKEAELLEVVEEVQKAPDSLIRRCQGWVVRLEVSNHKKGANAGKQYKTLTVKRPGLNPGKAGTYHSIVGVKRALGLLPQSSSSSKAKKRKEKARDPYASDTSDENNEDVEELDDDDDDDDRRSEPVDLDDDADEDDRLFGASPLSDATVSDEEEDPRSAHDAEAQPMWRSLTTDDGLLIEDLD